jgi:hypothetical protein
MFQTDQPTAANVLPTPAAPGTPGYFTNGNPATGVPATILDADFVNMLMLELVNVVSAGGLTPSKTTYTQVRDAIKRIVQNTVVLADTGAVNAYAAVNATPLVAGTWVDGVVQAVKIAHTNTGASTYAPDGLTAIPIYGLGLQPLQGGELSLNGTAILMHATIVGVNSGNPIAVLMECAGGAQQVPPATASQHAMQLGQATGRLLNVQLFSSSGTYTPTPGTNSIIVEGIGGGGAGGGTTAGGAGTASGGGGGSAGCYGLARFVSGIGSMAVTIGAGGTGVSGAAGGTGGTTSLGSLMTLPGGGGGGLSSGATSASVTGSSGVASAAGTITGAASFISTQGPIGVAGIALSATSVLGGKGADTRFGAGGQPSGANGTISSAGAAAAGYGAAGGGAIGINNGATGIGGSGFKGILAIYEYA